MGYFVVGEAKRGLDVRISIIKMKAFAIYSDLIHTYVGVEFSVEYVL